MNGQNTTDLWQKRQTSLMEHTLGTDRQISLMEHTLGTDRQMSLMEHILDTLQEINSRLLSMETRQQTIASRLESIENRQPSIESRLESIESHVLNGECSDRELYGGRTKRYELVSYLSCRLKCQVLA